MTLFSQSQKPAEPLPDDLVAALPGRFLVFEGPDGSGKSTQLRRFTASCEVSGIHPLEVREPGGTLIGESIRSLLLDHGDEDIDPRCEMLLYMASRAQLVERVIRPALAAGRLVVADRFISSTIAYQGYAGGVPIDDVTAAAHIAARGAIPTQVIVFDVDPDTAATRLSPLLDRMEAKGRAFHERVREGYHRQIEAEPNRYIQVDASRPPDDVFNAFTTELTTRLKELAR